MAELQVLTFDTRNALVLEDEGAPPLCRHCHDEIEAVGETIPAGEAPMQALYCLQHEGFSSYLVCAKCTLAIRQDEITQAARALAVARKQRQHVSDAILILTGQSPEPF